jgi:dienelactone hydrolase
MKRFPGLKIGLTSLALILISLSGVAGGNAAGWTMPKRSLAQQVELIRPHSDIRLPPSTTESRPVPTVILFHGCGGLRDVQEDYAAAALDAGYGVMIIGSNAARGIGRFGAMSQVCTALRLWGQERAADVHAAIEIAREDPRIDDDQLALVGWSHGGWTVLDALGFSGEGRLPESMTSGSTDLSAHVRAAIVYYPYCGFPVRSNGETLDRAIPLYGVLAQRDMVAPHRDCVRVLDRARSAGVSVEYAIWPEITHAFDEPNQPADPRMAYDPEAAARARAYLVSILDQTFDQG